MSVGNVRVQALSDGFSMWSDVRLEPDKHVLMARYN